MFNPVETSFPMKTDGWGGSSTPSSARSSANTGLVGDLIGAGTSILTNYQNVEAQKGENAKNRAWQQNMSNTAYQRAVADMKLAGLNPMVMYGSGGSGASTPAGSSTMAMRQNPFAGLGDAMRKSASTALETKRLDKDLAVADETIKSIQAQTKKSDLESKTINALLPAVFAESAYRTRQANYKNTLSPETNDIVDSAGTGPWGSIVRGLRGLFGDGVDLKTPVTNTAKDYGKNVNKRNEKSADDLEKKLEPFKGY